MLVAGQPNEDGTRVFRFLPKDYADTIHVSWHEDDAFAMFPLETAMGLIKRGYAEPISREMVSIYNEGLGNGSGLETAMKSVPAARKKVAKVNSHAPDDGADVEGNKAETQSAKTEKSDG